MAHYAFLDENNVVVQIIYGKDEDDGSGINWEEHYGEVQGMVCKRTSYNTLGGVHRNGKEPFRMNPAVLGGTYDPVRDAFIEPKPYPSWTLNEQTCRWDAPVPMPVDDNKYLWNEENQVWDVVSPT